MSVKKPAVKSAAKRVRAPRKKAFVVVVLEPVAAPVPEEIPVPEQPPVEPVVEAPEFEQVPSIWSRFWKWFL